MLDKQTPTGKSVIGGKRRDDSHQGRLYHTGRFLSTAGPGPLLASQRKQIAHPHRYGEGVALWSSDLKYRRA